MYIVTGGAGFVGSHIVRALNRRADENILVVDDLQQKDKFLNISRTQIADYMDISEFRKRLGEGSLPGQIDAIFHQGACTDTMEHDGRYMMDNNFTFSKEVLNFALARGVPLVYASSASVYGLNHDTPEDPKAENPLNVYAYSKLAFDQYVRRILPQAQSTVVGLRYFNVYGPNETSKGKMASMVWHLYCQIRETGVGSLFTGTDGYKDGGHMRDFVFVEDVADINLFFAGGDTRQGIFNVGTGNAREFNDIGKALIATLGKGEIRYIPFDERLIGKYQSFTQADLTNLRKSGYDKEFTALEDGVAATVKEWLELGK